MPSDDMVRLQHYRKVGILLMITGMVIVSTGTLMVGEVDREAEMTVYVLMAAIFTGVGLVLAGLFSFMVLTLTRYSMKEKRK